MKNGTPLALATVAALAAVGLARRGSRAAPTYRRAGARLPSRQPWPRVP